MIKRTIGIVSVLLSLSFVAACGKAPAEAALKAADEAMTAAKPDAEKFASEQWQKTTETLTAAKAKFEAGDYAAALEGAKGLPSEAAGLVTAAATKKAELTAAWTGLQSVSATVETISSKVTELGAMKKLPKGMDMVQLDSAKAALGDVTTMWAEASAAFTSGDLSKAVEVGTKVKDAATKLMGELSLSAETAAAAVVAATR